MSEVALPEGRLLGWYGDDFTGSAAVMEVLTFGGLPAVLFLDVPTDADLKMFPEARAVGIAGIARSQAPDWMDRHLPAPFRRLAELKTPLTHYKVCSTLDSSPTIGSIGHAIDIAEPILGGDWTPILVAAPPIRRYQAFGHLFAGAGEATYRLDRHPVMSRHPATPMDESDVARHLARQTERAIGCIDVTDLRGGTAADRLGTLLSNGTRIVTLDSVDDADLIDVGRLIWEQRGSRMLTVGSQGVEYALLAYWRARGLLPPASDVASAGAVRQLAAVSGSVSETTASQIEWAGANGFGPVAFDAVLALSNLDAAIAKATSDANVVLGLGQSVLVHTARGPDDPAVFAFRAALANSGRDRADANASLGRGLGLVLKALLQQNSGITRAVISGGDTSGHASLELGVFAFTALAPTIPGAALLRAHRRDGTQLELALKGGQMGSPDYFGWVRAGGGPRPNAA